jgi:PAS domain S-box-containing protein
MLVQTFSLRFKIMTLVSGTAFFTASILAGLNYYTFKAISSEKALEKLAGETQLAALRIKSAYDQMSNDAFILSRTPPVEGLIFSIRNGGIDPRDGTTRGHWHRRLDTIFKSIMEVRPHYAQIRYIGAADNGRELVRVNRTPDGEIETVEPEAMQEKGGELFFRESIKLSPGEFYLSKVTYNREFGRWEKNGQPTVRLVLPVFDVSKVLFGLIVVNLRYESFLREAISRIDISDRIYLADDYGNFVQKDNEMAPSALHVAPFNSSVAPDFIRDFISGRSRDSHFAVGNLIGYRHRTRIAPAPLGAAINTFVLVPRAKLFAGANRLLDRSLVSGGLLIATASFAALVLSNRLTRPMASMTAQVRALAEDSERPSNLPVHLRDEVGALARAFHDLAMRLDLSNAVRAKLSTQLDAFITNSVDGFVIINSRGVIEQVNPALLTMFGCEAQELIGQNIGILMRNDAGLQQDGDPDPYWTAWIQKYIGTIQDEEARHKDGSTLAIALSIGKLELESRTVYTAIIRDMTAVQHARREVERYAAELERSNQELDQFAYVASHDLKAPLRVINNASLWLEEDLAGKLTDEDRENMRLLRNRVQRMEKLLDDLLEYSRVGKTEDARYREMIDGAELIYDMRLLLTPPPGIEIRVADSLGGISVPRMPLQLVLYNLIANAMKHHDRGTGLIEVEAVPCDGFLQFTVRDDGPGIPKEFQEKIFEMFYTLRPRDQVEGSGMGLALVKKIVERWGGTITVSSDGGRGSAFTLTWPYKPSTGSLSEKAA